MGIFGFGKKKEDTKTGCCCGGACDTDSTDNTSVVENENACCCGGSCEANTTDVSETEEEGAEGLSVKVLGSGCAKCNQLEVYTKEALEQLGMDTAIEHVTDFTQIAAYGVMTTPALVVNEKVVSFGKVLKTDEVVKILQKVL